MIVPRPTAADLVAGISIAGLLLPEAVAYSGIAGLPPQAGVIALFAGLFVYGLFGSSRFAIISATSSSAAVLFRRHRLRSPAPTCGAADRARRGPDPARGRLFIVGGLARLGALSSLIAKPVLRGFAFGLALTIALKQLPKVLVLEPVQGTSSGSHWNLATAWQHWNWRRCSNGRCSRCWS